MSNPPIPGRAARTVALAVALAAAVLALVVPQASATARIVKAFGGPVAGLAQCSPDATAADNLRDATSRQDFCVAFRAENPDGPGGDDLKSQVVDTPRGFAGDADRTPQCTAAQFNQASTDDATCPPNTQVGEVKAKIRADTQNFMLGTVELEPTGAVYNLKHSNNEAALLGIDLRPVHSILGIPIDQPNVKIIVRVTLRPAPDVGLRSIIDNMPNAATVNLSVLGGIQQGKPLAVDEFSLLFWGKKSSRPMGNDAFAMLGSNCAVDQETKISAVAYDRSTTGGASKPFRLTNCEGAGAFRPSVSFGASDTRPDATTETTVSVRFNSDGSNGKTAPAPKKTVVVLPHGLSFSGQIASGPAGLPLCTYEQYGQTRPEASSCPDSAAVGTVRFDSPVLENDLTGKAFLGPQMAPGALPDLFIEAQLGPAVDAPRVKLIGKLTLDEHNRIVTTIDDLPEVPVDEFFLTFRGGDHAAVVTPPACGTFEGYLAATAWTGHAGTPTGTLTIPEDQPDCAAVQAFTPAVAFGLSDTQAGGNGQFATNIARPDRTARLDHVRVSLPPGQLADLKRVPECSLEAAAAASCPAATRVGSVVSQAGVGPQPYTATGDVYLTAREPGAVAGLSIVVPIVFGEVNLGTLAVPARVEIRPDDLGLDVVSRVPERFAGVPLNVRSLLITLDRPGFSKAPTNCGELSTTSTFVGLNGAPAAVPAGLKPTGCEKLGFKPELSAAITGSTKRLGRPTLRVRINNAAGNGALRQANVTLPDGIAADLAQVNGRGCMLDTFKAGGCPPNSTIGSVTGSLAIADEQLSGNVVMLRIPGQTMPGLGLNFVGRFAGRVVGSNKIAKTGQLISSFEALPDLPLTEFELTIDGGKTGVLVSNGHLCKDKVATFNADFVAHSGQHLKYDSDIRCGVPLGGRLPSVRANLGKVKRGTPTLVANVRAPDGLKIRQVDLTFPKGWTYSKARAKSRKSIKVDKLSYKQTKKRRKELQTKRIRASKLRVRLAKTGTTRFRIVQRSGSMRIKSKKIRRSKKRIVVTMKVTYTNGQTATRPIRLRPR